MNETLSAEEMERFNLSRWLFNPFYYVAGGKALVMGIIIILATGLAAHYGDVRFDGILDLYFIPGTITTLKSCLIKGVLWFFVMGTLLLVTGKIISKTKFRVIDVFGTQALARFPYLLFSLYVYTPWIQSYADKILSGGRVIPSAAGDMLLLMSFQLLGQLIIIWMAVLMYKAFSVSCNVSGEKAIAAFAVTLIIGEMLSKFIDKYMVMYL